MYPQTDSSPFWRRFLPLLLTLLIVALAYLGYLIYKASTFHIVSTDPSTASVSTVSPFFNLNLNRPLRNNGVSVSSKPNINNGFYVSGKMIGISLKIPLSSTTTYTLTVTGITDTAGEKLGPQVFSFTPQYILGSNLPANQQKALLNEQVQYDKQHSDPIVSHLPYTTPSFNLGYAYRTVNGQQQLVLNALLYIPQAFANNPQAAVSQDQQQIDGYISSLGLNPSNYTIEYSQTQE